MKDLATAKSIFRNHPFFDSGGGAFGYDWRTFRLCYPIGARILWDAMGNNEE